MKLPYRRGDSFELPLGDGSHARSCIVHCEHRVAVIAIGEDEPVAVLRVRDDALVARRWKIDRRTQPSRMREPENQRSISGAHAERQAAARLGRRHARERARRVFEVRDDTALPALIDADTLLSVVTPLSRPQLGALVETVCNHPGVMLRLLPPSISHLAALAPHLQRLTIAATVDQLAPLPRLIELEVDARLELRSVIESAPLVRALSWRGSGRFDPSPLRELRSLRTLALSGVEIERDKFPSLHHLRLTRTSGLRAAPAIASLRTLALEHLHDLARVDALAHCVELEQMELRGLWQLDIANVEFALGLPHLIRAELDIGGRRKNIELYRRARWAYPWRFPGTLDA